MLALLLAISGVGCSSPSYRIKQHPELFASFPPEAQALISEGKIAIGFEKEMVAMALGVPNRRYTRQTETAMLEVWSYTAKEFFTDRQRVNAEFSYRDNRGMPRTASEWVWVDVSRENEYERLRVEFVDAKVSAIETLTK